MPNEQILTFEGITLPSYWGGNFSNEGGQAAMAQISQTGANTITLIPNFFQTDKFSNTVKLRLSSQPFSSESDTFEQVRQGIVDAKNLGFQVVLKPHLETEQPRVWRAEIAPTDPDAWFASYKAMMIGYAKAAQAGGASVLCVGTEMKSMTAAQYTGKWVDLIAAVRAEFSGKITYAATYDEVTTVGFWDQVDYIGVDAYLPLSTVNNPTVDQMVKAWTEPHFNSWIRDTLHGGKSAIDYYKALSEQYGKQVIFTEVGYRSADGANKDPGIFAGNAEVDFQEQQDCYTALFNVMENYGGQWLAGSFLWSYHAFANPMVERDVPWTDYTPQLKPATATITAHYSSPVHVTGLTRNGTAGADKIDGGYHNDVLNGAGGNDTLWGGAGTDQLDGGDGNDNLTGGRGDDILKGGGGDNTAVFSGAQSQYTIARSADGTVTIADARPDQDGTDTLTGIRFAKFSDATVDLNTVPRSSEPPSNITGTQGPDKLVGTAGANLIRALAGNDQVSGGDGNDVILGDAGIDRLYGDGGSDALFGGAGNDLLYGGAGNDQLFGQAGRDTLSGGAGQDVFAFGTKPSSTSIDKILDFAVKDDTIFLDNAVFRKLGKGTEAKPDKLNKGFFATGDHAKDANDYLVYDAAHKILFYDADGSGAGAAVAIVSFSQKQKLTAADFMVI